MAKTYEAMMKAEEEAKKKQIDHGGLLSDGRGPSTIDDKLSSNGRGPTSSEEYLRLKLNILRMSPEGKIKSNRKRRRLNGADSVRYRPCWPERESIAGRRQSPVPLPSSTISSEDGKRVN